MGLKKMLRVWYKYQLSLNWLNILFRYSIKLLLFINLVIIIVGITHKFKSALSQSKFIVLGIVLIDLFLKLLLKKNRQNLKAFHIIPNGKSFLSALNILLDFFSLRNLILPIIMMVVVTILDQKTNLNFTYLFIFSCMNTIIAGFMNKRRILFAIATVILLMFAILYFQLTMVLATFITMLFLLLIYLRYNEKLYDEEKALKPQKGISIYNIDNPFLWLDLQILKKSKHLQLALLKLIVISILYCYIISTKYNHQVEIEFGLILLIQVYFAITPMLLLPYILSSNYSHIGLLMTQPHLKSFLTTKLYIILFIQFLLTLILYALNYHHIQTLLLISSLSIFNVLIITPIMFIGILLTDEKVNLFDSGISSILFIPSFIQSIYFFIILLCTAVFFYLLLRMGLNSFIWILLGLSSVAFFQRHRFLRFFLTQYYKQKYKLFKTLS